MFKITIIIIIITCTYRPQKYIWHGSFTTGERAIDLYCDSWDSDSRDKIGLASSLLTNDLLGQERFPCNHRFAVLCVETTSQPGRKRRRTRSKDKNLTETEFKTAYQKSLEDLF